MNILLTYFLIHMHSLFFSQVNAGVEGNVELPTVYTQTVENHVKNVKPQVSEVIDMHDDEKDEEVVEFDLGKPEPKEEVIYFDLGIKCEECE